MDGDVVALLVGTLKGLGIADSAGSDNEEGSLLVVCQQVVVQTRRVGRWTVCEQLQ